MADNTNSVDSLDIKITSDAERAVKALNGLSNALGGISKAFSRNVSGVRAFSKGVGTVAASLKSLNNIKIPDYSKLVTQIGALSKIKLDNLSKKIVLDIDVRGADQSGQLDFKLQKVLDSVKVDSTKMAKGLAKSYGLDRAATTEFVKMVNNWTADMAAAVNGVDIDGDKIVQPLYDMRSKLLSEGKAIGTSVSTMLGGIEREWIEFYNFFNKNKIYMSDMFKRDVGSNEYKDLLQGNLRYITTDPTKGIDLDANWSELHDSFPTLIPEDTINRADMLRTVLENIKKVRNEIKPVGIDDLSGEAQGLMKESISSDVTNLSGDIERNIMEASKRVQSELDNQLNLNIKINEEKIIQDIKNAVSRASKITYDPVKVKLSIDGKDIENAVSQKLASLDAGSIPNIADDIGRISTAVGALNGVNFKEGGLNAFVNALRRLAQTDMSNFNTESFSSMMETIKKVGDVPDVSSNVNRFVSAIARLANAGSKTTTSADGLIVLSKNISQVAKDMKDVSVDKEPPILRCDRDSGAVGRKH